MPSEQFEHDTHEILIGWDVICNDMSFDLGEVRREGFLTEINSSSPVTNQRTCTPSNVVGRQQ